MRGERFQIPLKANHHQPARETPFKLRLLVPMMARTLNAGLVALCIFRRSGPVLFETIYFCDFSGGSRPPVPPLDPHMPWLM